MTFNNNNKSQCLPCSHLWISERADDSCPIINKSVLGWSNGYSFAFSRLLSTICWLSFVLEALVGVDISPESLADSSLFNRQLYSIDVPNMAHSLGPVYEFVCDSFRTCNLNCFRVKDHGGQHGICSKT
jgi:hypothetical protein